MSILFNINKELNGIEIQFSEKPTAEILAKLKALGFRWNPKKFVWYAKNTDERLAFAKAIQKEDKFEQLSLFPTEGKPETEKPKAEPKKVIEATEKPKADKTTKATPKATEKAKNEPKKATEKPKKDNVIEFAKARPDVKVRMALDENASLEDCIAKIEKEKAVFKDSDSTFVLDGLLEMCKVNENFRNNFMQEDKTYSGAFKYFMGLAKKGFAHTFNGVAYMDNNLALGFAMDYYNMIEE